MVISAKDVATLRQKTGAGMMDCKNALTEAQGDFEQAVDLLRKKGTKISLARSGRDAKEGTVFACVNGERTEGFLVVLNCETDFVAKNAQFLALGNAIVAAAAAQRPTSLEALRALPLGDGTVEEAMVALIGTIGEKISLSACESLRGETVVSYLHTGHALGVLVALQGATGEAVAAAGRDVAMQIAAMRPLALHKDRIDPAVVEKERAIICEQVASEGFPEPKAEKITCNRLDKFFQENTLLQQPFVKQPKKTVEAFLKGIDPNLTVTDFKRISANGS